MENDVVESEAKGGRQSLSMLGEGGKEHLSGCAQSLAEVISKQH